MSTISNENSDGGMASSTARDEIATAESKTDASVNEASDNDESGKGDASTVATSNTRYSSEYEKFITYDANGTAIYTNPSTAVQYTFDTTTNQWIPRATNAVDAPTENPYENEHYRWCHETNQWILKDGAAAATTTENEFYRWDNEKHQWIPKMRNQGDGVSEYKDGVHTYTDKDGVVCFWDVEKNAWFPKIDDDFMAVYQMNYGFIDNTSDSAAKTAECENKNDGESSSVTETFTEATETPVESKAQAAKRKADASKFYFQNFKCEKSNLKKLQQQKIKSNLFWVEWFEESTETNTKVYVSNLPDDITEDEFVEVMSKCGMIFRDPATNKFKVKLYAEPNGQLKGDGLCHYIRVSRKQQIFQVFFLDFFISIIFYRFL